MELDRRETCSSSWYPFVAYGELLAESSDGVHMTQIIEISREGCHIQLANPLPVGTSVLVKVYAWPHFFQVHGTIYYSKQNLGTGVAFQGIDPSDLRTLEACLLEAKDNQKNKVSNFD